MKYKKGNFVIIRSMQLGGEVTDDSRPDGQVEVKVARMNLSASGVSTKIEKLLVKEEDLSLITKNRGLVII